MMDAPARLNSERLRAIDQRILRALWAQPFGVVMLHRLEMRAQLSVDGCSGAAGCPDSWRWRR